MILFRIFLPACLAIALAIPAAGVPLSSSAQQLPAQAPETLEEGTSFLWDIAKRIPDGIRQIWQEDVVPFWSELWRKTTEFANTHIRGLFENAWEKAKRAIAQETEEKREALEERLEEEREAIREEIRTGTEQTRQNLWERFKSLLRSEN